MFMCDSTCFGHFHAHHQEHTTALATFGFTIGAWWWQRCWLWSTWPRPTTLVPPRSNSKTRGC